MRRRAPKRLQPRDPMPERHGFGITFPRPVPPQPQKRIIALGQIAAEGISLFEHDAFLARVDVFGVTHEHVALVPHRIMKDCFERGTVVFQRHGKRAPAAARVRHTLYFGYAVEDLMRNITQTTHARAVPTKNDRRRFAVVAAPVRRKFRRHFIERHIAIHTIGIRRVRFGAVRDQIGDIALFHLGAVMHVLQKARCVDIKDIRKALAREMKRLVFFVKTNHK